VPQTLLPGLLAQDGRRRHAVCALGSARLVLRLDALSAAATTPASAPGVARANARVDACEARLHEPKQIGWTAPEWRRERKRAMGCLLGLLGDADLEARAAAAERLARERYWGGRKALTDLIHGMVGITGCIEKNGCESKPPAGLVEGLVLLRLVRAQLDLRQWVREEVLTAIARHGSPRVRLGLITQILGRERSNLTGVQGILIRDPDPLVRAQACNIGCQRDNRDSLRSFITDLSNPAPEIRANAVLYAGDCVRKSKRAVRERLRAETDEEVALLMLQAMPVVSARALEHSAVPALFSACPATRYLAARTLGRVTERPIEKLREALAREPNIELREQLLDLLGDSANPPQAHHTLSLWLEPGPN
jgi:hypothetical protein